MPNFDTDYLVEALKRKINVPTAQGLYSLDDFIAILDDELHNRVVPFYLSQREDFFLSSTDVALDSSVMTLPIPIRAIGQKFSGLKYLPNLTDVPTRESDLRIVSPGEKTQIGYYTKNDLIHLSAPFGTGYARIYFYRRPATLTRVDNCPTITNISSNTVTLTSVPSDWVIGGLVDFVGAQIPFKSLADDYAITNIAGVDVTFASLPTSIANGDYACAPTESPVPQIPVDAVSYLVVSAAVSILQGTNYTSAYQIASSELARIEKALAIMITPRADKNARKFTRRIFSTWPGRNGGVGF